MPKTTTPRGFGIYAELTDQHGARVRVQESSLATEACVWIFASDDDHGPDATPHLTVEQARTVRDALTEFIDEHPTAPEEPNRPAPDEYSMDEHRPVGYDPSPTPEEPTDV